MSFRSTTVVCAFALSACGSTAWAARCSGVGAVVNGGLGTVLCDDFDLYCTNPSNPDGSCHTNWDVRDEAAFEAVWVQDGPCSPNASMDLVTGNSSKGYDPVWQGYGAIHRQNQDIFTLSRHVRDITSEIQALDVTKDSVHGLGNVISSRGDDGAGYVDPFDAANPLPDTLKGQFFMHAAGGGAYGNFGSYLELYLDEDRAPTDFVMSQDMGIQQCFDEGINFPVLDTSDGNVHRSFAFGMMAFYDTQPCDVANGRRPTVYRAVVYDGLNWVQLKAPAFDLPLPDVEDLRLDNEWNRFYFAIGTDNIEVRLSNDKANNSVHASGVSPNKYFAARVPRQYKGPFNKMAMGMAKGVDLTTPAGPVCYPALSGFPNNPGNNARWDEVVLWDGFFEVGPPGACCLPDLTCASYVWQDECENTLGGEYMGNSVQCVSVDCCPTPWADKDVDGDVDQTDFAAFQLCLGETAPFSAACVCFNEDDTGGSQDLIDGADFLKFKACTTGPDVPMNLGSPPAGCTP